MVERLLSKPEVRGAIPRISEVKDIEQLINFLQKTSEFWSLKQEIPSQKLYNLLFADWNKGFLDSCKQWGCSSNGRASLCMREVRGLMPRISKTRATYQMEINISRYSIAYWNS